MENIGADEESLSASGEPGPRDRATWTPKEREADDLMVVECLQGASNYYFQAQVPWRDGHHRYLTGNFEATARRQKATHSEACLKRKGVSGFEIDEIIEQYYQKGYIERVPELKKLQGGTSLFLRLSIGASPPQYAWGLTRKPHLGGFPESTD